MFTDRLAPVINLYNEIIINYYKKYKKKGHPFTYGQLSFLMVMLIKWLC